MTITQEQLDNWGWDENHSFDIEMNKRHLLDWFNNIPFDEECIYDSPELVFSRLDDDTVLIRVEAPAWSFEVELEELQQSVLDRVYLKPEWVDEMPMNG